MQNKKKFMTIPAAALATTMALIIMGTASVPAKAANSYNGYATVPTGNSSLMIDPTLILEADSFADISAAKEAGQAASVIITPDAAMHVTLDGETQALADVYNTYFKDALIPVVRLDKSTVDAFIGWMNSVYTISDMMAVSSDLEVIQSLYEDEVCYLVNTVYDLTATGIPADGYEIFDSLGPANAAGCNILMYDAADPNLSVAASYVSSMTKVCWAYAEDKTEAVGAIAAGCYGIVSQDSSALSEAIQVFEKDGFARAQFLAAHRGITAYANEQSLTALAASENEGATHIEIDVQVTADREILICHNSDSTGTGDKQNWRFTNVTAEQMQTITLYDYSNKYKDTYPNLRDVIKLFRDTDMIFIVELKLDAGSTKAVEELRAIEALKDVMDDYPYMRGRWFAITFYEPYAEDMKELLPEIPVGFLGAATSGYEKDKGEVAWDGGWTGLSDIPAKIAFLRKYNMVFDESMAENPNQNAMQYLARGYLQHTWTFEDQSNFTYQANIATSNAVEESAMCVKEISSENLTMTQAEFASGKVQVMCETYCGWQKEEECEIIEVERDGNTVTALLYYRQACEKDISYGLYSQLLTITLSD